MKLALFSQSLFALPLDEAIATTARLGFPAIELACVAPHYDLDTARTRSNDVIQRIRTAGLDVAALSLFTSFTDADRWEEEVHAATLYIRQAPLFNTRLVKLTPGAPASADATDEHWDRLRQALERLLPVAREHDVRLACETHMRQLTDTLAGSQRLLALVPDDVLGLTVDFSNLRFAGEDVVDSIEQLRGRLYHAHVKNGHIDDEGHWHFRPLDQGWTDYTAVLAKLQELEYTGYLSIECLGHDARQQPTATAARDLRILQQLMASAGCASEGHPARPLRRHNALIGGVDKAVSRLALGTAWFHPDRRDDGFRLLDAYAENGGNLLDCARIYGGGVAEKVVGDWLADRNMHERMTLCTKGAHGEGYLPADFGRHIREELDASLTALQTDHVDLYMLHRDNIEIPVREIVDRLNVEIDAGRVKALGASNWTCHRIHEANAYAQRSGLTGFTAVSNNLSLALPTAPFYPGLVSVDRQGERWHEETRVPLLVWSSLARGFFTGQYTPELRQQLDTIDDPFQRRMLEVYATTENYERFRRARELGAARGASAVQVALAWLLHKPFPLVPIVGPHSLPELESCIEATRIHLTPEEFNWLNLA